MVDDDAILLDHARQNAIARNGSSGADSPQRTDGLAVSGRPDNLDVKLWSAGVFESTPYGYFHRPAVSTGSEGGARTYASRVKLDHYNVEIGPDALRKEIPRGKRTDFATHSVQIPKSTIQLS